MSALLRQGSSSRTIERKRQEIRAEDDKLSEEQVTRIMRANMTWWDWFVHDYARYWYFLGAIALDVFLSLGSVDAFHLDDARGIVLVIMLLVVLLVVEVKIFFRIWPRDYPAEE